MLLIENFPEKTYKGSDFFFARISEGKSLIRHWRYRKFPIFFYIYFQSKSLYLLSKWTAVRWFLVKWYTKAFYWQADNEFFRIIVIFVDDKAEKHWKPSIKEFNRTVWKHYLTRHLSVGSRIYCIRFRREPKWNFELSGEKKKIKILF